MSEAAAARSERPGVHVWALAAALLLVQLVWTNLTGVGIGRFPLTYDTVALPRLVVAVVGMLTAWALLGASGWREARQGFRVDITWASLTVLALWALISALASDQGTLVWLGQSERLEGVLTIALYGTLFGLGLQTGTNRATVRVLAGALVLGSTLLALHGLLQAAGLDPTDFSLQSPGFSLRHAFASLDNPNFLAAHLVLALPVSMVLAYQARATWARVALLFGVAVSLTALLATVSQGAWLGFAVQIAVGAGLWLRIRRGGTALSGRRAAGVVVGLLVAGIVVIVAVSSFGPNLGPSLQESGSGRTLLARVALDSAREHPLVGYGPDTYLAAFRAHYPPEYVEQYGMWSTNNNAHSWVVQYLATLGAPGALLLVAALALGLARGYPVNRHGDDQRRRDDLLMSAIWLGLAGYAVQSMFNVAMLASTVPFWVLLGTVGAGRARPIDVPKLVARTATAALVVAVPCALVLGARALQADATYLRSRIAYNGVGTGDAVTLARAAVALNPLSVKYSRGLAQARAQLVFDVLADSGASDDDVRERYETADDAYEAVLETCPRDYSTLAWRAALRASVAERLDDEELRKGAIDAAVQAAALDATAWQVRALAQGDTSSTAINTALSAPAVP